MTAEKVAYIISRIAPEEWAQIPEIKKGKPVYVKNKPVRLERYINTNLCAWYRLNSPCWILESDIYIVTE
jgi:hypothetical protein